MKCRIWGRFCMHQATCMCKVNFACLFFGYLNRNSHAHEHFTCTGTLPVPVHRYRGILRSLIKRTFDQFTLAQSSLMLNAIAERHLSVHRSASEKLAVVHSSCLFGAESYSGQRERKSVWQGFQWKICEVVSGKLSKCSYIHSYTHLITSSGLNECR